MKKFLILLILLILINFSVCYSYSEYVNEDNEDDYNEDVIEEINDYDDEEILFFKKSLKKFKKSMKKFGRKVKEGMKKASDKIKGGFEKIKNFLKNENTKAENKLCEKYCYIEDTPEQKEKEVISLLASIGAYSKTSKILKLNQLKNKLGRFQDWELIRITNTKLARSIILRNEVKREFLVAFRGTVKKSIKDWIVNLKFNKKKNPWGKGKIHSGFLSEVKSLVADYGYSSTIDNYLRRGYKLIITGHSQGAAEASIFAAYILHRYKKLGIPKPDISEIIYAPPRPGDKKFAVWLMENIPNIIRFQNSKDIVPASPMIMLGYHHVGVLFKSKCTKSFLTCHGTSRFFIVTRNARWVNYIAPQEQMCKDNLVKEVLGGLCK